MQGIYHSSPLSFSAFSASLPPSFFSIHLLLPPISPFLFHSFFRFHFLPLYCLLYFFLLCTELSLLIFSRHLLLLIFLFFSSYSLLFLFQLLVLFLFFILFHVFSSSSSFFFFLFLHLLFLSFFLHVLFLFAVFFFFSLLPFSPLFHHTICFFLCSCYSSNTFFFPAKQRFRRELDS